MSVFQLEQISVFGSGAIPDNEQTLNPVEILDLLWMLEAHEKIQFSEEVGFDGYVAIL